jgi:hypothetical protein
MGYLYKYQYYYNNIVSHTILGTVIKQCTEKETTSLSNILLTIKLNYLHDLKIRFQWLLHITSMYM